MAGTAIHAFSHHRHWFVDELLELAKGNRLYWSDEEFNRLLRWTSEKGKLPINYHTEHFAEFLIGGKAIMPNSTNF